MGRIRTLLQMQSEPPAHRLPRTAFIAGCMRSGTSFLVGKLSQHPQLLHVGSELNDIWTAVGGAPCSEVCQYRDELHFDVEYAQNMAHYFAEYARQSRKLRRHAMRWRHKQRTGSGRLTYDWQHLICINKSTHLTNKIRYVKSLFPNSKWIVLIRSIYGNAGSSKVFFNNLNDRQGLTFCVPDNSRDCWTTAPGQNSGTNGKIGYPGDFRAIPLMWLRLNYQLFQDLERIPSKDVLVVPYERLVERQSEQLMSIFRFLDLEDSHSREAEQIAGTSMKPMNTSTSGDPLSKWRTHLTSEELKVIADEVNVQDEQFTYINHRLSEITKRQGDQFSYPDPSTVIQAVLKP